MIKEFFKTLTFFLGVFTVVMSLKAADKKETPIPPDCSYEWLEEIYGEKPLAWVKSQNELAMQNLGSKESFEKAQSQALDILNASDRLALASRLDSERVVNFWQDAQNVRGILRQTDITDYLGPQTKWKTVLSIDELSKQEGENWVYKGMNCYSPKNLICLLQLSRGGTDASVYREFDLSTHTFVKDGFVIPSAKTYVSWVDSDTLAVSTDFGEGSMTESGYPRTVRIWKRGQPLDQATEVYSTTKEAMLASSTQLLLGDGSHTLIVNKPTFFENEVFVLENAAKLRKLTLPLDAEVSDGIDRFLIVSLRSDWKTAGKTFLAGSLVSLALDDLDSSKVELIFEPTPSQSVHQVSTSKNYLFLGLLDQVNSKLLRFKRQNDQWIKEDIEMPKNSSFSLMGFTSADDSYFYQSESFTQPPQLIFVDANLGNSSIIRSMPQRFDGSKFVTQQKFATSADGTKIPYYVVHRSDLKLDGTNPTLLYGYGGFEISLTPSYLSVLGKLWLEKGGVYVVANIRGGGEFGPKWHQAALKENRQRAYDDFISVAEDLIHNKITSQKHLGIMGGSNGGLLVGAVLTQRPDLFNAVVCLVPLLDMLRYTKLLAGASWAGEYGDPEDPKMREVIARYSPFQNVRPGVKYPEVFFYTSTKDDRVHPGHARKMAAKLLDLNQPVVYYENTEGGHAGSTNNDQLARRHALVVEFLIQKLMTK